MIAMGIGYFNHHFMHEDPAETHLLSSGSPSCSIVDSFTREGVLECEVSLVRMRAFPQRGIILALGFSISLHAALLFLVILASFLLKPTTPPLTPYITINMVDPATLGSGPEGPGNGSGTSGSGAENLSLGMPLQPDTSPVSEGAVECPPWKATPSMEPLKQQDFTGDAEQPDNSTDVRHPIEQAREVKPIRKPPSSKRNKPKDARVSRPTPESSTNLRVDEVKSTAAPPAQLIETPLLSQGNGSSEDRELTDPFNNAGSGVGLAGGASASSSGRPGGRGKPSGEFDAKAVDTPPTPLSKVEPEFPLEARRMGITGRVILKFLVRADGRVSRVSVIEANPGGIFEESALEAIKKWRFRPGHYQGDAVATWVELPIHFRLYR